MAKGLLIFFLLTGLACGQVESPERTVEGTAVVSHRDPKARVELPRASQYVGADRWILYAMDDCEMHAFVETDEQKHVRRLYWVQFEAYLPSRPELKHRYNSPRHARLGGLDFYVDTWLWKKGDKVTPGSDEEHLLALLRSKGYSMPHSMMEVRLVHLMDMKRKELMVIYGEDLAATGYTAEQLQEGGQAHDRWPAIQGQLLQRAEQKIHIENAAHP